MHLATVRKLRLVIGELIFWSAGDWRVVEVRLYHPF